MGEKKKPFKVCKVSSCGFTGTTWLSSERPLSFSGFSFTIPDNRRIPQGKKPSACGRACFCGSGVPTLGLPITVVFFVCIFPERISAVGIQIYLTVTALVPSSSLWAFNDPRILTWVTVIAEIFVLIVVVVRTFVLLCNKSFVNSDRRRKLPERPDRDTKRERGGGNNEKKKRNATQLAFTGGQICGTSARRSAAKMGWFWALALRANSLAGCVFALSVSLCWSLFSFQSFPGFVKSLWRKKE